MDLQCGFKYDHFILQRERSRVNISYTFSPFINIADAAENKRDNENTLLFLSFLNELKDLPSQGRANQVFGFKRAAYNAALFCSCNFSGNRVMIIEKISHAIHMGIIVLG